MPVDLLKLVSVVKASGEKGVTLAQIKEKMGKGKAAPSQDQIKKGLGELISQNKLKGFKSGRSERYLDPSFPVPARGKSLDTVAAELEALIESSETKLVTKSAMEKKVGATGKRHIKDALALLVSKSVLIKLAFGNSKLYLHRRVASEFWTSSFTTTVHPVEEPSKPAQTLTTAQVLSAYERLKREQRGIDTVLIYDLMVALNTSKEPLHQFIRSEMKAGRAFIHPSTTVNIPHEAIDYGIQLEGDSEVQVTVVFREKP